MSIFWICPRRGPSPFAEGEAPVQKNRMLSRRSRPFLAPLAKLARLRRACHRLHQRFGHLFFSLRQQKNGPSGRRRRSRADGRPLDPWMVSPLTLGPPSGAQRANRPIPRGLKPRPGRAWTLFLSKKIFKTKIDL